jgi:hypothetical protein
VVWTIGSVDWAKADDAAMSVRERKMRRSILTPVGRKNCNGSGDACASVGGDAYGNSVEVFLFQTKIAGA